jgi:folate-binding protein YgfZ
VSGLRVERPGLARLAARGGDRLDFLDRMATNELRGLVPGRGAPTFFLERTGRVVDRVLVLERGEDALLVGSEGRGPALLAWLSRYVIADDVTLADLAPTTFVLTVLGEEAPFVLETGLGVPAAGLGPWEHRPASLAGVTVARAEDVAGRSFHVIGPAAARDAVEAALAGLGAADADAYRALRIEAGVPAFGEDFTERTIPLETRQADHISFTKGCYVGQEVVARLHHHRRVKRALVRLSIEGAAPPAADAVLADGEDEVGVVTSATARGGRTLALGYVEAGLEAPGRRLVLREGAGRREVEVLALTPGEETA